jgi:hypothetical protein
VAPSVSIITAAEAEIAVNRVRVLRRVVLNEVMIFLWVKFPDVTNIRELLGFVFGLSRISLVLLRINGFQPMADPRSRSSCVGSLRGTVADI